MDNTTLRSMTMADQINDGGPAVAMMDGCGFMGLA
jgi:hypothetical protein